MLRIVVVIIVMNVCIVMNVIIVIIVSNVLLVLDDFAVLSRAKVQPPRFSTQRLYRFRCCIWFLASQLVASCVHHGIASNAFRKLLLGLFNRYYII